jgi:hypothetical protein
MDESYLLFYDATIDTHIVMNFASTEHMIESFRVLVDLLNVLKWIDRSRS